MLLDLDHFKDVNDTLGHPSGDRLLAAVAARLRTCSWDSEPPARLGGDEFALILPDLTDREHAAAIARRVIGSIAEPFFVDGHEIRLGASIGITLCPNDDEDPDNLLRNADLALYRAKEGRNMYQFYEVGMAAQVESRKALERDLRWALSDVDDGGLDVTTSRRSIYANCASPRPKLSCDGNIRNEDFCCRTHSFRLPRCPVSSFLWVLGC